MAAAHEEDVVIAFRQAVEEELKRVQEGAASAPGALTDALSQGAPLEDVVRRLTVQHDELAHEVALLRTIVLRLVSEPVDEQ